MTATPGISARTASLVLAALGATLFLPTRARAADEEALAPLRGLAGASVAVEDIGVEATRRGLTKKQVLADIEAQLRDGGVPLLTPQELKSAPGRPRLLLRVVTVPSSQLTEFACSLRLVLVQGVTLERDVRIRTNARTWETNLTGIAKTEDLVAIIRARVRDLADAFAKDFQGANPKR
jgi:hypothetical protein